MNFSKLDIGETMSWKSSLFLFAPAPWATSLKPWIWWNIWIIWSSSYRVSSGNQNWSWLRIVSYQSWFVNVWSPKLSKKFLKWCKKWKNQNDCLHTSFCLSWNIFDIASTLVYIIRYIIVIWVVNFTHTGFKIISFTANFEQQIF